MIEQVREMLGHCSEKERRMIFQELQAVMPRHAFEVRMNAGADVILEALNRASDLTIRGIRGVIGEATFVLEIIPTLESWENVPVDGDQAYDAILRDPISDVRVQVKMQRRERGVALIRNGMPVVEVQRTRGGERNGEDTRPYRFGGFDILAVCMEPSDTRWNSFRYIPERWLNARMANQQLIDIMQPVSLVPNDIWTDDFDEAVRRLRSGRPRPNA